MELPLTAQRPLFKHGRVALQGDSFVGLSGTNDAVVVDFSVVFAAVSFAVVSFAVVGFAVVAFGVVAD